MSKIVSKCLMCLNRYTEKSVHEGTKYTRPFLSESCWLWEAAEDPVESTPETVGAATHPAKPLPWK